MSTLTMRRGKKFQSLVNHPHCAFRFLVKIQLLLLRKAASDWGDRLLDNFSAIGKMPVMGETKAGDGWGSCSSGLEGEFSERNRPGRQSRDFQALTGYVNSADGPGLSGTMFSIPLCWESFTSNQVLCSVRDHPHLCPSRGRASAQDLLPGILGQRRGSRSQRTGTLGLYSGRSMCQMCWKGSRSACEEALRGKEDLCFSSLTFWQPSGMSYGHSTT